MARQLRIFYKNSVFHICVRGNNQFGVLEKEEEKVMFLDIVDKFRKRFSFKLYGYVLMDNHAHLLIMVYNGRDISKIMQAILLSFSVSYRKKYAYTGYVWQGRFKSNIIDSDKYLVDCLDYIHHNPVRAGLVEGVQDYCWSSYKNYNGSSEEKNKERISIDVYKEE